VIVRSSAVVVVEVLLDQFSQPVAILRGMEVDALELQAPPQPLNEGVVRDTMQGDLLWESAKTTFLSQ
jgi:hypothetical protein